MRDFSLKLISENYRSLNNERRNKVLNFYFWLGVLYGFLAIFGYILIHINMNDSPFFIDNSWYKNYTDYFINNRMKDISVLSLFIFVPVLGGFAYSINRIDSKLINEQNKENETKRNNEEAYRRQREHEQQEKSQAEINRQLAEKRAKEEARRQELQDIEDREAAKSRGQARGVAFLYEQQLSMLAEHRRKGMDIERELVDLERERTRLQREGMYDMANDLDNMMKRFGLK